MRRFLVAVGTLLLIPGTAFAGGGGGGGGLCPGFAEGALISMWDSCFNGVAHFAPAETILTISNDGQVAHTYTAVDGSFDSGRLQPGETSQLTIEAPTIVRVFCSLHGTAQGDGMAGVLVVGQPEPGTVAANGGSVAGGASLGVVKAAVAETTTDIAAAISRQTQELQRLAERVALMEYQTEAALQEGTDPSPTVLTLSAGDGSADWVPLTSGVAAGLALAALLITRMFRPRATGLGGK